MRLDSRAPQTQTVSFGQIISRDSWKALLAWGQAELTALGPRESRINAEYLLEEALGVPRRQWHGEELLTGAAARERYQELVAKRKNRVPAAYVTGRAYFRDEVLEVGPGCLIPRPETEQLVEFFIRHSGFVRESAFSLMDLGTGSGAIAISLLRYFKNSRAALTDISEEALALACRNIQKYGLETRSEWARSDLFQKWHGRRWNVILSNPPYLAEEDWAALEPELFFEPRQALDGGKDGMHFYRRIADQAADFLEPYGWLVLEAGLGQAESIRRLLADQEFRTISIFKDDAEIDRVIMARRGA